jgi:predicted CopG family antitoxin
VAIEMAKVTLSVPDDFYEKLEKHKDRLNYSDIFRRAVSEEIERIEKRGELIEGLIHHLSGQLTKTEDKERIRKEEIERFTKKWGIPDIKNNDEDASHRYVSLQKRYKIKSGEQVITELHISNHRGLASLHEQIEKGSGKYDISLYGKNLEPIVEFLKSQGFIIAEEHLTQDGVMLYVLQMYGSQGRNEWSRLASKGYDWYGLFAADNDDCVFIAYREVKPL